jgi:hypothetical protein
MKPPKVTLSKIEQEIDLKELFGVDLSEADGLKKAIGQVLLDKMLARVEGGEGIGGVKLKSPYSKPYAESLQFKAAGKSKGKVNMTLTGDMLASIDIKSTDGNKIVLAIDESQVEKAFNHQTGDTVPKRPFFGFTKAELKDLKKEFTPRIKEAAKRNAAGGSDTLFNEVANELLETIDEEF